MVSVGFFPRVVLFLFGVYVYIYIYKVPKTEFARQPIPRRGSSNTFLGLQSQGHQVRTSQHRGRPQSTVKVTQNEVPDHHPQMGHSTSGLKMNDLQVSTITIPGWWFGT